MALTTEQKQRLIDIDYRIKQILLTGGEESLLLSLHDFMGDLKKIMDASTQSELSKYCQEYDGFYRGMKLLENLAAAIADGSIAVPS